MLNKFGYFSALINEIAATVSLDPSKLLISKHSALVKIRSSLISSVSSLFHLYCFNHPDSFIPMVSNDKVVKVTNVPKTPNSKILPILSKNFYLLILNPKANIIGGKTK